MRIKRFVQFMISDVELKHSMLHIDISALKVKLGRLQ